MEKRGAVSSIQAQLSLEHALAQAEGQHARCRADGGPTRAVAGAVQGERRHLELQTISVTVSQSLCRRCVCLHVSLISATVRPWKLTSAAAWQHAHVIFQNLLLFWGLS